MHSSRSFSSSLLQYLTTFLYFVGAICLINKMEIPCMIEATQKMSEYILLFCACCSNKGIVKSTHTIYNTL